MVDFLKKRWVLLLVLITFVLCKLPHLQVAYYWDESWPYAVAIKAMFNHGPSLMPGVLDPEFSRGHPLFFHAAAATWMQLFGDSHVSVHSFALLISLLLLVVVYEAGLKLFDERVACISIILVATQVIFFVQSAFLLPEMLVAFLSFLSIYAYTRQKYLVVAVSLAMLFYTKESGLITGFVIGIHALIMLFNRSIPLIVRLRGVMSVAVPCVLIGIFFLIQKQVHGWYIFPLHSDLIEHKWDSFWYCFQVNALTTMFERDNRYMYFLLLSALSILAAVIKKNYWYLILFFPCIVIGYCLIDKDLVRILSGVPFLFLVILSVAATLHVFTKLNVFETGQQKQFVVLLFVFIFCFLCFSSTIFFTPRYLLTTIVSVLFITSVLFAALIKRTFKHVYYAVLVLILLTGVYSFKTSDSYGDADMGAFDAIDVQQHVVDYMEQNKYYDKAIGCKFLGFKNLTEVRCGFLRSGRAFTNVKWDINGYTDYAIFDNIENDARHSRVKKDTTLKLVYRYQKGKMWAEVYGRK
ncbi:MAG: hypothetical protein K0Q79_2259 [Flavipsychrobacter sp.]|jgi:4-amino-4-deoxy-L-arabinose transferase-like glycosyltransferase|nr:hypothetical protein [Flavipsychrobacter sp.]